MLVEVDRGPRGLLRLLVGLLALAWTATAAHAQWSLTRPADRPGMSMRRGMRHGSRRGSRPSGSRGSATRAQGDRVATLIARYRGILARDPRETFAFQRLLDLYRERDGNVDALVRELEAEVERETDAFAARMLLGHVYKAQGRVAEARRLYEQAAALRTDDPAPLLAMAHIDRAADPARSRALFERALEHTRDAESRREILRQLGDIALEQEDWDGARTYYQRLARGAGSSIYLRTEFARALAAHSQHERAIGEYERVLASLRGDNRVVAPVLRDLARAQLDAGRTDDAIATLERALRVAGPRSGIRRELYDVLVEAYRRADRLPQLAARLARARDFDAIELLGRIHDELGDEEQALAAYRRALRMNPRHIDTRVRLVQLLSRSGRIEDVIAEYRQLVRIAPREPRFVVELAQLLMQVGRRDEALRLADQVSRRHRGDVAVHQALAELYTRWGEGARASREVAALVRIDPRDPSHLIALGEQQLEEGQREQALATWRRLLTVESDRARAHASLAAVLADHDFLGEAEQHYRRAVLAAPTRVEYLRGLAALLERPRRGERRRERQERDLEAARWWTKVLEIATERAERREARQRVVAIWGRRGELQARLRGWLAAFAATPPDVEAGRFLAEAYLRMRPRNVEEAERVLERIVALAPGDVESLVNLERVRTARGDLAGAIEVLRRLVEADPRRAPRYLQRMAEHALALYRDEDAVRYAAEAVARTPDDAEGHRRLGDLYRARQDLDHAITSYRRAIELNDRLFATYFDLAELYLARGDHESADRLYRQVLRSCLDDDLVARAGRASIQLHLGAGTLESLERDLLPLALGHPRRPIYRKLLVELYDSLASTWMHAASGDGPDAVAAREALHRLGVRAIKPLLEALADEDPTQQRVAVEILGHLGNENATAPLLAMVEGDAPVDLRARALIGAGTVAPRSYADRFASLARGPERRLRPIAAWALARMGGPRAVASLRTFLTRGDPGVRAYAALGLGRARDRSSAARLEELLREDRSPTVQAAAAWALGRVGDGRVIPSLVVALRRGRLVSRASADALGRLGRSDETGRATRALARALFEPEVELQRAAAAALRRPAEANRPFPAAMGRPAATLEALLEATGTAAPPRLEPLAPAIEAAARDALRGPVERVMAALQVLAPKGRMPLGLGRLTVDLEAWPLPLRQEALTVLERLAQGLSSELVSLVSHPEARVRELAVRTLARAAPDRAVPALVRALGDDEPRVLRAALEGIGSAHAEVLAPVAELATAHPDWSVRLRAAQTLGRLGDAAAVDPLLGVLARDAYAFVREAAVEALGAFRTPAALEALRQAARTDPEPRVREAARRVLETPADGHR